MKKEGINKVVIDACVLYQAPTRDLILYFASYNLFMPIWTNEINNEWIRNLLLKRKDIKSQSLHKAVNAMNEVFPNSNIIISSNLINKLELPDPKD